MFKSIKDQIWFFDCEWAPDPKSGRLLYDLPDDMPDADVVREMWARNGATEENPQPFLKTYMCRIVSIAAVMRRVAPAGANVDPEDRVKVRLLWLPRNVNDEASSSESSILTAFLGALGKHKPQLVGFNSRASDLKILFQRAMVTGIMAPDFCQRPDKPWEGVDYFSKDCDYNIDLMDSLGGFAPKSMPSLNDMAILCGIPGKIGTSGDDVANLWLNGQWREIVEYNCFDALSTYLLWLRMAHLSGHLDDDAYECEQMILTNTLLEEAEKPDMQFLNSYLEEWNRLQEAVLK